MTDAEPVRDAARHHAPDFYLSALLAPRAARGDLVTLAAYLGEIARVPLTVAEAPLAEIRLQWWRDAILNASPQTLTGNPVADALNETMLRRGLPRESLLAPIDAYDHLLARGTLTETAELAAYIDGTSVTPFQIAARMLEAPNSVDHDAAMTAAGHAYGCARVALDLPYHLARGRWPLPLWYSSGRDPRGASEADAAALVRAATDALASEAWKRLGALRGSAALDDPRLLAAVRPVALVEQCFAGLHKPGRDPLRQPAEIAPLARATRLWLARWRGVV